MDRDLRRLLMAKGDLHRLSLPGNRQLAALAPSNAVDST